MRFFFVSGFRPLMSSAHASDALSNAPVEVIAIEAAKPLADRCRNPRRESACLAGAVSVAVMGVSSCFSCPRFVELLRLLEAAVPLQHLDFVAVGIFDEEEARDQFSVLVELDDLARLEPFGLETAMLSVEVLDHEGDVAVAVA